MRLEKVEKEIEIPEGIEINIDDNLIKVKGKKGEIQRDFKHPSIKLSKSEKGFKITGNNIGKKEKALIGSIAAHAKNMFKGANEGHCYKLKVCSGHFPMSVAINGNKFTVKNFYGEKIPRTFEIREGVTVKLDGSIVTVEGNEKEKVAQTAANIEQLMRITNRDRRVFQDGIYIIEKDGKEIK